MLPLLIFSKRKPDDLILGRVGPARFTPRFSISAKVRKFHFNVVGMTGRGKSKFLQNCLVQDIMVGRGCAVVDPHGDLAKDVLGSLVSSGYFSDESVYDRLMYVAPRRRDYIIPFNVLSSPDPDTETYEIAQRVISAYMRTWAQMGKIPHTRIGRNIRIRESDLKKWLDAHRIEGDKRMIKGLFPLQLQ